MSLRDLAAATGLAPSYLSRIESGVREPSWATLRRIAAVWRLEPIVHLVAPDAERQEAAAEFALLDPDVRLCRRNVAVFEAVVHLARNVPDAVMSGAAAAVLQGVLLDVPRLEALVPDTDETIAMLVEVLRRSYCLYDEPSPQEFRLLGREEWVVREADAFIRLVNPPAPSLLMTLDDVVVRVATLAWLIGSDPVVADAVGAFPPSAA